MPPLLAVNRYMRLNADHEGKHLSVAIPKLRSTKLRHGKAGRWCSSAADIIVSGFECQKSLVFIMAV